MNPLEAMVSMLDGPVDPLDLDDPEPRIDREEGLTCRFCNGVEGMTCECVVEIERRCARCLGPVVRFKGPDGRPHEWCDLHGQCRVSERHVHYPKGLGKSVEEPPQTTRLFYD